MDKSDTSVNINKILYEVFKTSVSAYNDFRSYIEQNGTQLDKQVFLANDFNNMSQEEIFVTLLGDIKIVKRNDDGSFDVEGNIYL